MALGCDTKICIASQVVTNGVGTAANNRCKHSMVSIALSCSLMQMTLYKTPQTHAHCSREFDGGRTVAASRM